LLPLSLPVAVVAEPGKRAENLPIGSGNCSVPAESFLTRDEERCAWKALSIKIEKKGAADEAADGPATPPVTDDECVSALTEADTTVLIDTPYPRCSISGTVALQALVQRCITAL
jgi:hypothetical protein